MPSMIARVRARVGSSITCTRFGVKPRCTRRRNFTCWGGSMFSMISWSRASSSAVWVWMFVPWLEQKSRGFREIAFRSS